MRFLYYKNKISYQLSKGYGERGEIKSPRQSENLRDMIHGTKADEQGKERKGEIPSRLNTDN